MPKHNKTKEELLAELKVIESKENDANTPHKLTVMDELGNMEDLDVTPNEKLNAVEKAKISTSLSQFQGIREEIDGIMKKPNNFNQGDFFLVMCVMDEVTNEVLSIVYNIDDKTKTIPSLPNGDLLSMFVNNNAEWIGQQALSIVKQLEYFEKIEPTV